MYQIIIKSISLNTHLLMTQLFYKIVTYGCLYVLVNWFISFIMIYIVFFLAYDTIKKLCERTTLLTMFEGV